MHVSEAVAIQRNIHNFDFLGVQQFMSEWEPTPHYMTKLDMSVCSRL